MTDPIVPVHRIAISDTTQWREAVRTSLDLLRHDGLVAQGYVDAVLTSIESGTGTYMDLGGGVLLAHSRPENGALGTGMSLCVLRRPVLLADDPQHAIRQVWGMCAVDSHSHQGMIARFAQCVMDPDRRDAIGAAASVEDIVTLLD